MGRVNLNGIPYSGLNSGVLMLNGKCYTYCEGNDIEEIYTAVNSSTGTFTATVHGTYFAIVADPSFEGGVSSMSVSSTHTPIYAVTTENCPYVICELEVGDTISYSTNPNKSIFAVYKVNRTVGQRVHDVRTGDAWNRYAPSDTTKQLIAVCWSGKENSSDYMKDECQITARQLYRHFDALCALYVFVADNPSECDLNVYAYYFGEARIVAFDLI